MTNTNSTTQRTKQENDIIDIEDPGQRFTPLQQCCPNINTLHIMGNNKEILDDIYVGRRIGIIGTRSATQAGLNDTRYLASILASYGFVIVSGMALGIDGAAHQGALDAAGLTIAVLGSGLDVIYPSRHKRIAQQIKQSGCIISEYDNSTSALAWHFPLRNRIIAALSDVLVVTEGTIKGGARITVDLALAMGKPICALPGPRRSLASELPNALIRDGATTICDPSDVLSTAGITVDTIGWEKQIDHTSKKTLCHLNSNQQKIFSLLSHQPLHSHEISYILNQDHEYIHTILVELENMELIHFCRGVYQVE